MLKREALVQGWASLLSVCSPTAPRRGLHMLHTLCQLLSSQGLQT